MRAGHPDIRRQRGGRGPHTEPSPRVPNFTKGPLVLASPRRGQWRLQQHRRVEELQVHVLHLTAAAAPGHGDHRHPHHAARHVYMQGQLVRQVRLHQRALEAENRVSSEVSNPTIPPRVRQGRGGEGGTNSPRGRRKTRSCPHRHLRGCPGAGGLGHGRGHSRLPHPGVHRGGVRTRGSPAPPGRGARPGGKSRGPPPPH